MSKLEAKFMLILDSFIHTVSLNEAIKYFSTGVVAAFSNALWTELRFTCLYLNPKLSTFLPF